MGNLISVYKYLHYLKLFRNSIIYYYVMILSKLRNYLLI